MPNRRRSNGPRVAPKLFKCTGYGDCNMVFTRSEHLARHERKHTGEKPYKCVVPGCERMFSRFDNMMQHTQTHDKSRKNGNSRSNSSSTTLTAKVNKMKAEQQQCQSPSPILHHSSEPVTNNALTSSIMHNRTLPPPTRRASLATEHPVLYPPIHPPNYYSSYNNSPRNRSSWPARGESYPYPHYYSSISSGHYYDRLQQQQLPPLPPHYYVDYPYSARRRSSTSTASSESTLVSPIATQRGDEPEITRRRISIDDLRLPIQEVKNIQLEEKTSFKRPRSPGYENKTIDITPDEFEALEGFSKFHTTSVVGPLPTELTPSPVLQNEGPHFASQVCALRQRVMTLKESFQRG